MEECIETHDDINTLLTEFNLESVNDVWNMLTELRNSKNHFDKWVKDNNIQCMLKEDAWYVHLKQAIDSIILKHTYIVENLYPEWLDILKLTNLPIINFSCALGEKIKILKIGEVEFKMYINRLMNKLELGSLQDLNSFEGCYPKQNSNVY